MSTRLPRAPEAPLPELAAFLAPLAMHFVQRPSVRSLERYVTGLLTEHPTKNCDTLAQVLPDTSEQRLQYLLTDMAWDQADLNRQRVRRMLALPTEGDAVLIFDDTGFAKQGARSVGVQRQYSGTLGRTGNCRVAVTCHYAERTLAWPVDTRLYLPKRWVEDRDLRRAAHVPDAVTFHTKPQLALALLDEARALGVPHACVTVDAGYGDAPSFLNALEQRREPYVVAIASDFTVATTRTSTPARADALLAGVPRRTWTPVTWAEGAKGLLQGQGLRPAVLPGRRRRHAARRVAARPARQPRATGAGKDLLAQLRSAGRACDAARVRAPAPLDRAVLRGGQRRTRVGPVPGPALRRLPPPRRDRDARLQLPGVARVAGAPAGAPTRPHASAFFPLGPIGAAGPSRTCTAPSPTGCSKRRFARRSAAYPRSARTRSWSNKAVLTQPRDAPPWRCPRPASDAVG